MDLAIYLVVSPIPFLSLVREGVPFLIIAIQYLLCRQPRREKPRHDPVSEIDPFLEM